MNFNTIQVTDMMMLFGSCDNLQELYINNFIISSDEVILDNIFSGSNNITKIYLNDTNSRTKLSSYIPTGVSFL